MACCDPVPLGMAGRSSRDAAGDCGKVVDGVLGKAPGTSKVVDNRVAPPAHRPYGWSCPKGLTDRISGDAGACIGGAEPN
jgi:hypothetical protein